MATGNMFGIKKGFISIWKLLLILVFVISGLKCFPQIIFEKGYFISETNERTDCLIKNIDWKNNPVGFAYKLTDSSEILTADIQSVNEFGIYNISKYVKANVLMDRSGEDLTNLSSERNPALVEDTVFLKVLIEGMASLYSYEEKNLTRFFYSTDQVKITQLIYKIYAHDERTIQYNNQFRQQLLTELMCPSISITDIQDLNYYESDLIPIFVKYNECQNTSFTNYNVKHRRELINLTIRPGLNLSNFSMENTVSDAEDADFDYELTIRAGLDLEIILPFNKNKWALFTEPTFQYYNSVKEPEGIDGQEAEINYKSIELPVGIRHYFFLDEKSKLFLDVAYVIDFCIDSAIKYELGWEYEISSLGNAMMGFGYKYKNISAEIRYLTSRNLLTQYPLWNSDYRTVSIIFGYSLF